MARARLAELSSEMHIPRVVVALNVAPCPFWSRRLMVMSTSDKGRIAQYSLPYLLCREARVFFFFQYKHGFTGSAEPLSLAER